MNHSKKFERALRRQAEKMLLPLELPHDWREHLNSIGARHNHAIAAYDALLVLRDEIREEAYTEALLVPEGLTSGPDL